MSILLSPASEAKPTGEPSSVATSVNWLAELLAEGGLVIGGGGPGLLLRRGVVLGGQVLDAVAEDFAQQRRVGRQERPQRQLGMRAAPSSRDLPGGAVLESFEHDAHGGEFVADAVGFLEVLCFARGSVARIRSGF